MTPVSQSLSERDAAVREGSSGVMSALGQKQTFAMQYGMSALPPKADIRVSDHYPPAPGKKHLICVLPSESLYGHTTASPNLFGAVTSASGGTSIHWLSSRTRYLPSFVSQSTSSTLWPSANEQQNPLRLARLSNHRLSGEFSYFPSRSRGKANPGKNSNDNAAQQIMPR